MTRTIFAARSGCAPPWRCPSTLWPSSCYPTWPGRHSRDGHACRNHLALCPVLLNCHWPWAPTPSRPIELANAYATFAAAASTANTRLISALGAEAIPTPPLEQDVSGRDGVHHGLLMKSVVESGTARAAGLQLQRPAAGKTGTSNGSRDAWFRGVQRRVAGAVWVGFDDGKSWDTARPAVGPRCLVDRLHGQGHGWTPGARLRPAAGSGHGANRSGHGLLPAPGAEGISEVFLDGTAPRKPRRRPASRRMRIRCCSRRTSSHHNPATAVAGRGRKRGRGRGRLESGSGSGPGSGPVLERRLASHRRRLIAACRPSRRPRSELSGNCTWRLVAPGCCAAWRRTCRAATELADSPHLIRRAMYSSKTC